MPVQGTLSGQFTIREPIKLYVQIGTKEIEQIAIEVERRISAKLIARPITP